MLYRITDWDDAYANARHIPDGEAWPARWAEAAAAFRQRHMPQPLGQGHLFRPDGDLQGLVVFVHGGYWMRFDPSLWSHLAAGPLAHGWAVALPAYTLAPAARIPGITQEVARTIAQAAAAIAGPIALTGHSAGGHLTAMLLATNWDEWGVSPSPINGAVPVSGLFDLEPLRVSYLNEDLKMSKKESGRNSPIHSIPKQMENGVGLE